MTDDITGRATGPDNDGAAANGRAARIPDNALGVDTLIYPEDGRWAVDISVLFRDGVVRRRIDTYPTRQRAEISARLIRRGAERDLRGPANG